MDNTQRPFWILNGRKTPVLVNEGSLLFKLDLKSVTPVLTFRLILFFISLEINKLYTITLDLV